MTEDTILTQSEPLQPEAQPEIQPEPQAEPKKMKKRRVDGGKIAFYVWCALFTFTVVVPFLVIMLTSVTTREQLYSALEFSWFPSPVSFDAYGQVFVDDPLAIGGIPSLIRGFFNTLWMALITVSGSLFFSALAAYGYSKIRFRGKEVFYMIELATMLIPTASMTIPTYVFFEAIGWTGTPLPVILPGMFGGASAIFFFRAYFTGISDEYLEAARIDGLNEFQVFLRIMIPLSVPAFIAQFIFAFVGQYNAFMGPLLYLQYDDMMITLQLAVNTLQGIYSLPNQVCAIALIALLPIIVLYLFCQRLFIEGIAVGGGKE